MRPALAVVVFATLAACESPEEAAGVDTAAAGALSADLQVVSPGETFLEATDPAAAGAPKVVYLYYSDGNRLPASSPDPCDGAPPKFACQFGASLKDCQMQVQSYLDRWYADFNVVFTLTRPTSGWYYTEVVSSGGGAWCAAAANVAGIAPFLCNDLSGGVAYTFMGGQSAKETAIIIAQEQAHLVGLEHTLSNKDIMDPTICSGCDGFENVANKISKDNCGRATQNSYQMMKDRLGGWAGGVKPTPFGCDNDRVAPSISIVTPADGASVATTFVLRAEASDDCRVKTVSVRVSPMGLQASSSSPPYEWTLNRIKGQQTITVTATDPSGKSTTTSITVNAGGAVDAGTDATGDAKIDTRVDATMNTTVDGGDGDVRADGAVDALGDASGAPGLTAGHTGCDVGGCGVGPGAAPLQAPALAVLGVGAFALAATRRPRRKR